MGRAFRGLACKGYYFVVRRRFRYAEALFPLTKDCCEICTYGIYNDDDRHHQLVGRIAGGTGGPNSPSGAVDVTQRS